MHAPPAPNEVDGTVVTDHRMVFSISPAQTVLWDQIRYSGNPSDFAWVLPVKPGARIELSQDAWIATLDAATQTIINGPSSPCTGSAPREYDGPGPGGCGSSSASASGAFEAPAPDEDAGSAGPVQVVSQSVVGPYDAVTVRSSQGEALGDWLRAHGYEVPAAFQPTIDAFTSSGFDFIALRLAPGEGVQAMQPVRVVTPGADPYLPLRMVAAGVGANVAIELWVLSEGRYHPQNFPDAAVDFSKLAWDPVQQVSNYRQLEADALAANGGRGWVTESAGPANLYASNNLNPGIEPTYQATCRPLDLPPAPGCGTSPGSSAEAGPDAPAPVEAGEGGDAQSGDAATSDAGTLTSDAGSSTDSGVTTDAGTTPPPDDAGTCQSVVVPCDDLDLALTGMAPGSLWVTRLRANLAMAALSADLILEATPQQDTVTNIHSTSIYTDPSYQPSCPSYGATASNGNLGCGCHTDDSPHAHYEDVIAGALLLAAGLGMARRRRRPTRA
jgi:MYXO-CTERM domain-containing protein